MNGKPKQAKISNRNEGQGCPHCRQKLNEKMTYNDARKEAHKLNLKHKDEWRRYIKSKKFDKYSFPRDPYTYYKRRNEWISWSDFLGLKKSSYLKIRRF